jgi:hypothetical protein
MFACWLADPAALAAPLLREGIAIPDENRLPTVDVAIRLSDREGRYRAEGTLGFINRTGKALGEVPLVLSANEGDDPPVTIGSLSVVAGPSGRFDESDPAAPVLILDHPLADGEGLTIRFDVNGVLRILPPNTNDLFAQGLAQMQALRSGDAGGDYGLLATGDGITVVSGAIPRVVPFVDGAPARHGRSKVGDLAWNGPASFKVLVTTPRGLDVVTNLADGPARTKRSEQSVFAEGVGPSDVVIVAARDWVVEERRVDDVIVRSWARERDRVGGIAVADASARALRFLERYGRYPFRELDLVEASLVGGVGGVEYGGMALVGGFLYQDPARTPLLGSLLAGAPGLQMSEQLDFVVAHEVAHQWSPGLVGADAWNHPIVDEPLAQYLGWRVCSDDQPPDEARARVGRLVTLNYALMRLLGGEDGPADQASDQYPSPVVYAGLIYGKAPGLYLALEDAVGRGTLDQALRRAFAERAWTTTAPDGWLASLERGGATGAVALGRRWWDEAHGDEDLGLDPSGRTAIRLLLGPELAARLEQSCAVLTGEGTDPAACLRSFVGPIP